MGFSFSGFLEEILDPQAVCVSGCFCWKMPFFKQVVSGFVPFSLEGLALAEVSGAFTGCFDGCLDMLQDVKGSLIWAEKPLGPAVCSGFGWVFEGVGRHELQCL